MRLDYCRPSCSVDDLSPLLIDKLSQVEKILGTELWINSAKRSISYEQSKGRDGTSAHVTGLAVDIHCNNSAVRYRYVSTLLSCGFKRIGIYPNFIHADLADQFGSKPDTPVIWLGK